MVTRLEVQKNTIFTFLQLFQDFFFFFLFFASSFVAALPDNENHNHHHRILCLPYFCFSSNLNDNRRKQTTRENGRLENAFSTMVLPHKPWVFPMVYTVLPCKVTPTRKQTPAGARAALFPASTCFPQGYPIVKSSFLTTANQTNT